MFFSKKKKDIETFFVCDLGSSSVGGSLITFSKKGKAQVLWQDRIDLNFSYFEHRSSFDVLKKKLTLLVERADKFLFSERITGAPKKVMVSLSSPWYLSRLKKQEMKKEQPFVVSREHIKGVVQSAAESLRAEILRQQGLQADLFQSGSVVIEQQTIDLKINGYSIKNPINTKARDLRLTMMISIIPKDLHTFLSAVFDGFWSNTDHTISSFPYTHFNALSYLNTKDNNLVLIDVSGVQTEITYIEQNSIQEIVYTNMGKNHFSQRLSQVLGIEDFMAESEFKLFAEGNSTVKQEADLSFILKEVEDMWKHKLEEFFDKDDESCSRKYILTVDPGFYSYFETMVKRVLYDKDKESEISVIPSNYQHDDIVYLNNISKDDYLEIAILSLLNSR